MNRAAIVLVVLVCAGLTFTSCGNYTAPGTNTTNKPSGLKFRAFVANPLQPVSGSSVPVFNIVDAEQDVVSFSAVPLSGAVTHPELMFLSPDLRFTLVFSSSNNAIGIVDNQTEKIAATGGNSIPAISLPGLTESVVISSTRHQAFAAVPSTPWPAQPPGSVEAFDISTGAKQASIQIPAAHYLVQSGDEKLLMVISDDPNTPIQLINPASIGTSQSPTSVLCATCTFDHPVGGVFSADGSTAYILNCGAQCGGAAASISVVDVSSGTSLVPSIPVDAATVAMLSGNTLYVAGTPPGQPCTGSTTAATECGKLDVVNLTSRTVAGTVVITNGRHNRIEMADNGQLFIGARSCAEINAGGEIRGCLSIVDPQKLTAIIPAQAGDVTGIAPITGRSRVYVGQNQELWIYDTTTDKLIANQIDISGQVFDVKLVDK